MLRKSAFLFWGGDDSFGRFRSDEVHVSSLVEG
jgi:hypothetical protein